MKRIRTQERQIQRLAVEYAKMPKGTFKKLLSDTKQMMLGLKKH